MEVLAILLFLIFVYCTYKICKFFDGLIDILKDMAAAIDNLEVRVKELENGRKNT